MHLYYFNVEKKGILRVVSELPLEVNDQGCIQLDINIKGHSFNMLVPSEVCFYFDGAMCLYSAPKEFATAIEKATDTLDAVVLFMSGFQKFIAPFLLELTASEKVKFRDALYSLNTYQTFSEEPEYSHIMVLYFDYLCNLKTIGNDFEPKRFFNSIRKGN